MPRGQAGRVEEQNWWGLRGEAEEHTSPRRQRQLSSRRPVLPELQIVLSEARNPEFYVKSPKVYKLATESIF